jgi:DNA polymerase-3 subunit alpha
MNEVAFSYKERKQNNLDNMISFSNVNDLMFPGLPLAKEGAPVWSSINVTHNETVPTPSIPQGFVDSNDYLRHLVQKGTINRFGPLIPQNVKERINQELSLIEKKGVADYILFVLDAMESARKSLENCLIIGLHGQFLCSMVNYVLNITSINPIDHHLPFEMFLNESRRGIPNICIDVDEDSKEKFIALMKKKYGNRIAPLFYEHTKKSDGHKERRFFYDQWAIAERNLNELMPICEVYDEKRKEQVLCPQFGRSQRTEIHEKGAMVQSIISWRHLSTINRILRKIAPQWSNVERQKFLDAIPLDDPATMEVFRQGNTEDIFLFDGEDMRKYLTDIQPNSWMDLLVLNSLRGSDAYNTSLRQELIFRKKEGEAINYSIPAMAKVLDETCGLLLYKEQLILLAHKLGNLPLSEAYTLSSAMQRLRRDRDLVMNHYLPLFIKGGCEQGYPQKLLEQIFTSWWQHGGFAKIWSKSSDMGLVLTAYQMAYLKVHYSKEWTEQQILKAIFHRP